MSSTDNLTPLFRGNRAVERVYSRIHYKMRDYATYRFTAPQSCAINIFFDLAQEFDATEELYVLSVLILHMFFQYEAEFFLKDEQDNLVLVTPALHSQQAAGVPELRPEVWKDGSRCYIPVRGKDSLVVTREQRIVSSHNLLGALAIRINGKSPEGHELLFLEKFANRVGFCLHNKTLANRNAKHILFVRKLTHDIGHNVITPNMRLKLMLNHLEGQIKVLGELAESDASVLPARDVRAIHQKMDGHINDIMGAFKNSALFLESLLRQSHFDVGHYVLHRTLLDIRTLVVTPQFERYKHHFAELRLRVGAEQPELPSEPCMVRADLGLISQALANFFSNAVKYASREYDNAPGEVRCSVAVVPGAFEENSDGVKVAVFSSGPHIPKEEAKLLFHDSYRASNAFGHTGTGHGLFFVREIVAEHGGVSGYEPSPGGNTFYFMLPRAMPAQDA